MNCQQNKRVHTICSLTMQVSNSLPRPSLCPQWYSWLSIRTIHTSLPLHLHFPVQKMQIHLSQINTSTDTWYTPYHSGCSSAQRVTLLSCFSPASSWPQCLSGLCVFLSLWCSSFVGRGYKSLCRSQSSPGKLYTWPRRCCFHLKLV